jgi:hypothetical protein
MAETATVRQGVSGLAARAGERARRNAEAYEHGHDQPLGGYAGAAGAYAAAVVGAAVAGRLAGRRLPARFAPADLALGGLACHKFVRIVAKDAVASPLRAPFTRFRGAEGSAELAEDVRGEGARHAVGEMVSCPFCLAPWTATAYVAGLATAPRLARAWAAVFSVVGVSDMLQHAYGHLRVD